VRNIDLAFGCFSWFPTVDLLGPTPMVGPVRVPRFYSKGAAPHRPIFERSCGDMLNRSWLITKRLQTKLLVWTALILIVSLVVTFEVRIRMNARMLEDNLRARSETMIRAVNAALGLHLAPRAGTLPPEVLGAKLREFVDADPTLTRLDVVQRRGPDTVVVASSSQSSSPLVPNIADAAHTVIRDMASDRSMVTSQAIQGTSYGIVAVASMANIDRFLLFNRSQVPPLAAALFLIVITLMHLMFKRTVSRRFDELLEGIRRAERGEAAQIPDSKRDEIGLIAETLNGLITEVRSFSEGLRRQVATATDHLNQRNIALETSARQMVEMQQQLLESQRLATVGQMAATFAHEIGSPMASLSAHVQLLLEDPDLSSDSRETLAIVREQIQLVVQIVNEMLRSARRGPSDFVFTEINEILQTVVRLVQPKLMSQKVDVTVDFGPIPPVRGYGLYLQEAFLNIINNAADAMPAGGCLKIKSSFDFDSHLVNIWISDTGPGIDESVVEKVFDHFVTTKAIGDGTGLGLGIVKEIVDSHRGTFRITGANGGGTLAHITLPAETISVLAS
jgi:signal transduction histidine kinase